MRLKPKLEHLLWVMLIVMIGIGWYMKGNTDPEAWLSLFSPLVISNFVFAAGWLSEWRRCNYLKRFIDPEVAKHL